MPAPLTGALFVRNNGGKSRKTRSKRTGRRAHSFKAARSRSRTPKRNPVTGRFVKNRKNASARRNPVTGRFMRANHKNTYKSRGKGKARKSTSRSRSRSRGRGYRNNTGLPGTVMLTRYVGKVPGVGRKLAPFVTPAITGALALVPIHLVLKFGGAYLPPVLQPMSYTIGGLAVALVGQVFPKLTKRFRTILGATAVTAGAVVDLYRYLSTTGAFSDVILGDGGAYDILPADPDGDALAGEYRSAANYADAYFSGADLSGIEGQAAVMGAPFWRRSFGPPPRVVARNNGPGSGSHLVNRPGHKWGWLIALVGWPTFRQIAALPPARRVEVISELRQNALATANAAVAQGQDQETAGLALDTSGLAMDTSGLMFAGAAY